VFDIYDSNTLEADLRNVAEAFRLCAVLLLYRCFPDLQEQRRRNDSQLDQAAVEKRMTASALHALNVLKRNGVIFRTRSAEQILLVIIAGELRFPTRICSPSSLSTSQDRTIGPEASTVLPTFDAIGLMAGCLPIIACTIDIIAAVEGLRDETQKIQQARATLRTRMDTIRSILPYKSVEQAEKLIWDVWWKSDNGENCFWMDLMIRNGQRFVMVRTVGSSLQEGLFINLFKFACTSSTLQFNGSLWCSSN
jgi:hypothetical protein